MYWFNFKNWEKTKYAYIFVVGLISFLLLLVVFKNINVFTKDSDILNYIKKLKKEIDTILIMSNGNTSKFIELPQTKYGRFFSNEVPMLC